MDVLMRIEQSGLATWVREAPTLWAYPTVLFLHTVGLGFLVGLNVTMDLRILGVASQLPLAPMRRFFPIMWMGFWINAASGFLLLAADATAKLATPVFYIKMILVGLGVVNMRWFKWRLFREPHLLDQPERMAEARFAAVTSLLIWIGATTAGRLMGYLGPVSGLR